MKGERPAGLPAQEVSTRVANDYNRPIPVLFSWAGARFPLAASLNAVDLTRALKTWCGLMP